MLKSANGDGDIKLADGDAVIIDQFLGAIIISGRFGGSHAFLQGKFIAGIDRGRKKYIGAVAERASHFFEIKLGVPGSDACVFENPKNFKRRPAVIDGAIRRFCAYQLAFVWIGRFGGCYLDRPGLGCAGGLGQDGHGSCDQNRGWSLGGCERGRIDGGLYRRRHHGWGGIKRSLNGDLGNHSFGHPGI